MKDPAPTPSRRMSDDDAERTVGEYAPRSRPASPTVCKNCGEPIYVPEGRKVWRHMSDDKRECDWQPYAEPSDD